MFPHLQHHPLYPHKSALPRNEGSWCAVIAGKHHQQVPKNRYNNYSANVISQSISVLQCYNAIHWRRYFWDILIFERVWRCPTVLNAYQDLQTSSTEVTKAVQKKNRGLPNPRIIPTRFPHPRPCTSRECSKGIWSYKSNFAYSPRISSPRPAAHYYGRGTIQLSQQKRRQLASISAGEPAVALSFRLPSFAIWWQRTLQIPQVILQILDITAAYSRYSFHNVNLCQEVPLKCLKKKASLQ